jgi:DNA-binding GntR family transcriptional regulator
MPAVKVRTAYQHIAESLRRQILDGELRAGQRLPPERELCEHFRASRITIRRALEILADETLIVRRQGSGTFVSHKPSRKIPLLNTNTSGSVAEHAPEWQRKVESWAWQPATEEPAALLGIAVGERLLFARRLDLLDASAIHYDDVYLPEQFADRLDETDFAQVRFLERWQGVQQIRLDHLTQTIEAVSAESAQVRHLGGKIGDPILKSIDITFLSTGTACGVFISHFRHDLFRLTSKTRLHIPAEGD